MISDEWKYLNTSDDEVYFRYAYVWYRAFEGKPLRDWVVGMRDGGIYLVEAAGPLGVEAITAGPFDTVDEAKAAAFLITRVEGPALGAGPT